jgi:uncharacterized protein YukJ
MKKTDQTALAKEVIENLVDANNQSSNIGEQLAELMSFTNENFENPLTEELEQQINTLEGTDLAILKESIKGELQPRLAMKHVQEAILDTDLSNLMSKKVKVTIKKVKSTMIGHKDFPQFTQEDLGKFKVITTPKGETKPKQELTFTEELMAIMDTHGKTVADVRVILDNMAAQ